jgi:protein-arginine kinase activator protein McsA
MAHICKQCDKKYSSYKSLWFHNYKYHKEEKVKNLEKEIKIEKHDIKKFICDKCNKNFNSLDDISNHSKNDCRPSIKSNNVYKFKTDTFGKNKYKNFKGGDVYIIQTEFNLKGFYKIGVSTDLYNRLSQYRCGNLL